MSAASATEDRTAGDGWTRLERTRTRPNRRALLFAFLGLLLYGAGSNVGAGWVIVVAAMLLGTLPFAWFSARRAADAVDVQRSTPGTATTDQPTRLALVVRAPTAAHAVVHDHLSGAVGQGRDLRDGTRLEAEATLPRGVVVGGTVEVQVSDVFGLVDATAVGEVPADIEVLPAVPPVHGSRPKVAWAMDAGEVASRVGGGAEVLGVREYQHGDPVRAVHWRTSARRDQLVVRQYAEESQPRVLVEIAGGTWERDCLDTAVEVVCGVAQDARRSGYPTDVAVDGTANAWGQSVRRHLALLPPHAGAGPRALAQPPHATAQVVIRLEPGTEGPRVVVRSGGGIAELGALPTSTPRDRIGPWLTDRLQGLP